MKLNKNYMHSPSPLSQIAPDATPPALCVQDLTVAYATPSGLVLVVDRLGSELP